jgi:phage baseplate assembly protein W
MSDYTSLNTVAIKKFPMYDAATRSRRRMVDALNSVKQAVRILLNFPTTDGYTPHQRMG